MKAIRPRHRPLAAATACLLIGLIGSCAAPRQEPASVPVPMPSPAPTAQPAPPPPPLPPPPADWRDAPRTPGSWTWGIVAGRSSAVYGADPSAPLATLTCDRASGRVMLARAALRGDGASQAVALAVTTTGASRALLSDPALSPPGWLVVPIAARDPILDAMAFSRGRFTLEAQGQPTLTLPSWPEVSRVIEDCR